LALLVELSHKEGIEMTQCNSLGETRNAVWNTLPRVTSSEYLIAGSALLLLLAAQWILSSVILATNYYGGDGKMVVSVVLTAFKFGGYFDVTNLTPLQSPGTQLLPKNAWANPAFWPFAFLAKEMATDVSALIALACFASAVYVMMRCFDVPVLPSALAAQSCITLFAPALLLVYTPTNFCLTPADAVVYAPYMIALGLLARTEVGSWRSFSLTTAAIFALIIYSVWCDPLFTMIPAMSWAVPFGLVAVSPLQLKTIMVRCAALGCCLGMLLLSGAANYLYTISQYTARVQFAEAVDRIHGPQYVSAMTYSPNMKYFYAACALGWLLGLVTLRGRSRVLILAAVAAFAVWVGYSISYLLLSSTVWISPIPIYMEQCLFPLFLSAAVAGYWGSLSAIASLVARDAAPQIKRGRVLVRKPLPVSLSAQSTAGLPRGSSRLRRSTVVLMVLCVAVLPIKVTNYALTDAQSNARYFYLPWTTDPEFVQLVTDNIGRTVGQPYRGAINFSGGDYGYSWTLVSTWSTTATLWSLGVATLNEYSQLATPESFYFSQTLLNRDTKRGYLNSFSMRWSDGSYSPVYWRAVEMFGVRYSAERRALPDEINPGLPLTTLPHHPYTSDDQPGTWYLYELPNPNVGNYSPTEVISARSGSEIMTILRQPGFDFTKQVVVSDPLTQALVPATEMRLWAIRGGLHVSGKSVGTSLVILPQQFSHCLRAHDSRVRLVRANLMMAGLIFSSHIDTDILFDYGIFSPGCRRADLVDLKQLDLKIDLRMPHLAGDRLFPEWNEVVTRLRAALDAIR
jgi:hypothetical protein